MSLFSSNDEHFCTPFALHNKDNSQPRGQIDKNCLEPENEYGNVEYKLKLTDPTPERVERLVTQLKWRIREGQGEAILFLGVKDNGMFVGLTPEEIKLSLQTLERMSSKIGAKMSVVNEKVVEQQADLSADDATNPLLLEEATTNARGKIIRNRANYGRHLKENAAKNVHPRISCAVVNNDKQKSDLNLANIVGHSCSLLCGNSASSVCNGQSNGLASKKSAGHSSKPTLRHRQHQPVRKVIQVVVKRKTHDISEELKVAVLGPTESGKSTLLGVLSHGEYDNGRGSARLNLFRHRHEIRSGHTSSISQEIFGFNSHGQPLTYRTCLTTEEIIESSSRIVTLIDLAGHQRYLSTTLFGLGSYSPDVVLLIVSAVSPITSITTDHISLALGIEKSLAIVINKIDLASKEDQEICYCDIVKALELLHPDVKPIKISDLSDAINVANDFHGTKILPIFFTSCVTDAGMKNLYAFFNQVACVFNSIDLTQAISGSSELQVDDTFEVPGIGKVISGLMVEGIIREGDEMLLGPDDLGNFSNVTVASLQRHKIPCNFARAGQKCTMALMGEAFKVRRGMILKEVDSDWQHNFPVCLEFEASIKFITNKTYKLGFGSQVSAYVGNVKQTCTILSNRPFANNSWLVHLKFTKRPEYIREGSKLIVRHALTKGIGVIRRTIPLFVDG